jgi:hypothetical protein
MRVVYVARDPVDAELVRQLLSENGIDSVVKASVAGITTDTFPAVVVIREADAERARVLIAER